MEIENGQVITKTPIDRVLDTKRAQLASNAQQIINNQREATRLATQKSTLEGEIAILETTIAGE